jgi:hypothetical protein
MWPSSSSGRFARGHGRKSRQVLGRAARRAATAALEPLETRRMLFNTGGQWNNPDELTFSYINVFDGGIQDSAGNPLPDANIRSAILEGMSVWTGVAPIKITQVPDSGPNPPNDIPYFLFDSRLRFGHHFDDGVGNDLAHAWLPDAGSSLAGDVHFDNAEPWSTSPSIGTDLIETAAHEVGHALGMKHEDGLTCLMNSNYAGRFSGPGTAFLFQDDINGIQSMYGVGLGYVLTDVDRLFVSGTNAADEITVDYDSGTDELVVTSVGIGSFRIDEDEVAEIVVDARGGNDVIRIQGLDGDTTAVVNAGIGNDTVNVGDGDLNTNVLSDVTVNGDSGTDTLIIRDGDDDGGTYNVTINNISKTNSQLVSWTVGDLENVTVVGTEFDDTYNLSGNSSVSSDITFELQGNGGADTFNINEVDDRATVNLLGGALHDTFNIGNGDYDTNIDGDVDIDGGDSGDIVTVNDRDDVGNDEYTLDAGYFERPTGSDGILTYSNVSTFHLDANGDNNEINVLGVASGVTTQIDGRGGDDTFNVGDYDYDTNILGTVSITGGNVGTTDFLRIRDSNDNGNDDYFFAESATFGNYFDKDSSGILIYSELEEIHLLANNDANDVYVSDTPAGTDVTLYGQNGNDDFFIGTTDQAVAGDLDPIDGGLVIWAGTGNDTVTYDDTGDAPPPLGGFSDSYTVTTTTLVKTIRTPVVFAQTHEHNEVEGVVLDANSDSSSINVLSTAAGTTVTLNGNDGNDTFNVGENDNVAGIDGEVVTFGGLGTDALNYNDAASTGDHAYTVGPNEISRTNVAGTDPGVESVTVNAGTGSNVITVPSNNQPTTINGGGGDDTFLVGTGLWDAAIQAPITVNGDAGTDGLVIDDSNDAGADGYNVTATQTTKNAAFAGAIDYGTIESYELAANSFANVIQVNGTIAGEVLLRGRGGADDVDVIDHAVGSPVTIEDGPDMDQVRVNSDGVGSAQVQFESSQDLALLNIGPNSRVTLLANGSRSILTQALGMTTTSVLDLADNDMVLDYTGASPMPGIIAVLIAGFNAGGWNGASGIVSSVAALGTNTSIGYAEATDLFTVFPATFAGRSVDNTSVLLKYTYNGDANLDGAVDLSDFNKLAANFGASPRRWVHGNSNFDAVVNLQDFNRLAANFGQGGLAPAAGARGEEGAQEQLPSLEDLIGRAESRTRAV